MKKLLKSILLTRIYRKLSRKSDIWAAISDSNIKKDVTIEFENGSRLYILSSQNRVRGNRAKEFHFLNNEEYEQIFK